MKALTAVLGCILLVGCGSPADSGSTNGSARSRFTVVGTTATNAFALGVNLSGINSWGGTRPFLNLIYGSSWQMQNTNPWGGYENVPASSLDSNGWVKSAPEGYRIIRGLSVPLAGGTFVCRYQGNGKLNVEGPAVSRVTMGPGRTHFTLATTYPNPQPARLTYTVEARNYIRDLDCRESTASTADALAPEFTSALSGFKVIRFMDWQTATGSNAAVSWSSRNKPGDGDYLRNDGVPVELLVQTGNQLGADIWVTVPWNADTDYVTRFASYARDNLASGHRIYVEVGNEVWNGSSRVGIQACNEAKAEYLTGMNGGVGCNLERYAVKTKQVMGIWSSVFAGQMNRLVRVASLQHVSPYWSNAVLSYKSLYESVDALATAPYFGEEIKDNLTADQIMAKLPTLVDKIMELGIQQKAIAQKYGLRYITYEGGQTIVLPNNRALEKRVERDPRMFDIYKRFLSAWQKRIGDDLNLYNFAGGISQYGAWGLIEYVGQPLAQAPKMRAVKDFIGLTNARATSSRIVQPPASVCQDQAVQTSVTCLSSPARSTAGTKLVESTH